MEFYLILLLVFGPIILIGYNVFTQSSEDACRGDIANLYRALNRSGRNLHHKPRSAAQKRAWFRKIIIKKGHDPAIVDHLLNEMITFDADPKMKP